MSSNGVNGFWRISQRGSWGWSQPECSASKQNPPENASPVAGAVTCSSNKWHFIKNAKYWPGVAFGRHFVL